MEKKIFLLADDDMDDRGMFCEALEIIDNNIVCHAVSDGRDALHALNSLNTKPLLIFLDINMPVMNGWQCLEKIKADDRYNEIPVIIISTSSHQREMDIARNMGALCYFTKPLHFDELTDVLRIIAGNIGPELPSALKYIESGVSKYVHTFPRDNY